MRACVICVWRGGGGGGGVRLVVEEPVVVGLVLRHVEEEAAEQVRHEDEEEDGEGQADDGPEGLEPVLLLELVEPGHELGGADELEHADELEGAEEVGGADGGGGLVVGEGDGDDQVEGEAPQQVGQEPGGQVVLRDEAEVPLRSARAGARALRVRGGAGRRLPATQTGSRR